AVARIQRGRGRGDDRQRLHRAGDQGATHGVRGGAQPPHPAGDGRLNRLVLIVLVAVADAVEADVSDEHEDRRRVDEREQPVPGVCEDGHELDEDRSQRPSEVKPTMTTSIQYWERVASRARSKIVRARSWARIRPATWPMTSAATWTYQMLVAPIQL